MSKIISSKLLAEAEREETVFRSDFGAAQGWGFPPFTFFGWAELEAKINDISHRVEDNIISLAEGHVLLKGLMEQYYGCPYPLDCILSKLLSLNCNDCLDKNHDHTSM